MATPYQSEWTGPEIDDGIGKGRNLGQKMRVADNGNVGVNLAADAGQLLHLGDGNILLEGGGETAMLFKLGQTLTGETTYGTTHPNAPFIGPIFQIGRIIQGGDGAPQFRWMFSADNHAERVVFELDSEGILSSVRQAGVRGSHFEAHGEGDEQPLFRLNSYPYMQLQMGNGGDDDTDVSVARIGAETGALQYGPPAAQETALEWSEAGINPRVPLLTWPHLAEAWSVEPSQVGTATVSGEAGAVWEYTLDGVTRYRFVPDDYNPTLDAFYSEFTGGALSGLIVARG